MMCGCIGTKIKALISMQDRVCMTASTKEHTPSTTQNQGTPSTMQNQGLRFSIRLLDCFALQPTPLEI